MEIKINKDKNNTYKIDITVEKERVNSHINQALEHEAKNVDIKGFRKGKAPLKVVKENVDQAKLRNHALNHIVEEIQKQVLTENKFAPIVYPRYEIKEFEEDKDMTLTMIIIEKPNIEIGDYKKAIKAKKEEKVKAAEKAEKKEKDAETPVQPDAKELTTDDIIDAVLSVSKIEPAEQLVTEETDRMMSSMLKQLEQMGITIDKYLEAVKKTAEEVRAEYMKVSERNIKSDFAITEIAQKESIEITDEEIEQTINAVPDEKSKAELSKPEQKMYIRAVLLKNKTLQKLAEGVADTKEEKKDNESSKSSSKDKEEKK